MPVPAPKPAPEPARATSRSRKSVGSATNTAAASDKGTKAARAAKSSVWSGSERQALYKVQGEVDISAPDFWEQVSEGLADVGLERSADECQLQWFAVSAVLCCVWCVGYLMRLILTFGETWLHSDGSRSSSEEEKQR